MSEGLLATPGQAQPAQTNHAAQQGAPSTEAQVTKSWFDSLPDELKSEASLKNFTDVSALAKSYVHLNRTARSEKIPRPNQYFTDDDWKETYKALGLPETVDKYDFKLPEGAKVDEQVISKLKEQAHAAGILPKQFEKLFAGYFGIVSEQGKAIEAQKLAAQSEGIEALKKEWGQAFDREVYAAQVAVEEFGGDALRQALVKKGLANDPDLIRLFAKIGNSLKEDAVKGAANPGFKSKSPQEALNEANMILGDLQHPYHNREHPHHQRAIEDVKKLYEMAYSGSA